MSSCGAYDRGTSPNPHGAHAGGSPGPREPQLEAAWEEARLLHPPSRPSTAAPAAGATDSQVTAAVQLQGKGWPSRPALLTGRAPAGGHSSPGAGRSAGCARCCAGCAAGLGRSGRPLRCAAGLGRSGWLLRWSAEADDETELLSPNPYPCAGAGSHVLCRTGCHRKVSRAETAEKGHAAITAQPLAHHGHQSLLVAQRNQPPPPAGPGGKQGSQEVRGRRLFRRERPAGTAGAVVWSLPPPGRALRLCPAGPRVPQPPPSSQAERDERRRCSLPRWARGPGQGRRRGRRRRTTFPAAAGRAGAGTQLALPVAAGER